MQNLSTTKEWLPKEKPLYDQPYISNKQPDFTNPQEIHDKNSQGLNKKQVINQTYVEDTSVEQDWQESVTTIINSQQQAAYPLQMEEFQSAKFELRPVLKDSQLILFFTQFMENAIISNYTKSKKSNQLYILFSRTLNQSIKAQIFKQFQKIKIKKQISCFLDEKQNKLDLIHINNSQTQVSAINSAFFLKILKAKYFSKNTAFLWKLKEEIDFDALKKAFQAQNIQVYLLDKQTLVFINREESKGKIGYKNYDNETRELEITRDPTIYEDIVQVQTIYLDPLLFQIAEPKKDQNLQKLLNLMEKYIKKKVYTKYSFQSTVKVDIQLKFEQIQQLPLFLKEMYQHGFELTSEGLVKQMCHNSYQYKENNQSVQNIIKHKKCSPGMEDLKYSNLFQKDRHSDKLEKDEAILKNSKNSNQSLAVSIQHAKMCLKQFQVWDFLALWNLGFKQVVQKIIDHWDIYVFQLQEKMIEFTRMTEYKLQRMKLKKIPVYLQIFKDISQNVQKLVKVLCIEKLSSLLIKIDIEKNYGSTYQQKDEKEWYDYQRQKRLDVFQKKYQIKKQSMIEDIISAYIYHKTGPNKDLPFIMKIQNGKQNVSHFIAERVTQPSQLSKLTNTITIINYHLGQKNDITTSRDLSKVYGQKLSTQASQNFFTAIEEERIGETRCIGCSTFFKVRSNIFDETINTVPFKVFPSVQKMKDYESQIKVEICSMLNSGGGFILFDCIQHYQRVIVRGISLNEKSKEQYQQRFTSYLDTFQPKINIKRCIDIKFVPVVADQFKIVNNQIIHESYTGEESLLKQNQSYRLRPYLQNVYVMRVKICPLQGQKVYFWNQNNDKEQKEINKSYLCTAVVEGVNVSIKMSKIARLIKQKMKKYYLSQKFKGDQRKCLEVPFTCFNHQCRDPQAGVGAHLEMSYDKKILDSRESGGLSLSLNNRFQYSSLLIIKRQHLSEIKRKLISEGIQCQIEQKFKDYKFQSAKNSAVLYHNKRFEDILKKVLQNPKFVFNGRPLILINITNYLKLSRRNESAAYPVQDFFNLKIWLRRQFPEEKLKLFEFKSKEKQKQLKTIEYYLQTQSSQSTLFIYYILNKYGEKATFKNPLHLDKMSLDQKTQRFRQIYVDIQIQSGPQQVQHTTKEENVESQIQTNHTSAVLIQTGIT